VNGASRSLSHNRLFVLAAVPHDPERDSARRKLECRCPSRDRLAPLRDAKGDTGATAQLGILETERSPRVPRDDAEWNGCPAANEIDDEIVEFIVPDFDDGATRME